MLRQRGDNDRQAIAHHEGSQATNDKCSDRKSVDEIGRLSGNGRCNALPMPMRAHPDLSLFARHQSPACGVRLGACGVCATIPGGAAMFARTGIMMALRV